MYLPRISKNKFKLICTAIIIFALIAGIIVNFKQTKVNNKNIELLKAMSYDQVQEGDEIVEDTDNNVSFDAFFVHDLDSDGEKEEIRGTCKKTGEEDTLYIELSVLDGTLKNAQILVNEDEGIGNIYLQGAILQDNEITKNVIGNNIKTIDLNTM